MCVRLQPVPSTCFGWTFWAPGSWQKTHLHQRRWMRKSRDDRSADRWRGSDAAEQTEQYFCTQNLMNGKELWAYSGNHFVHLNFICFCGSFFVFSSNQIFPKWWIVPSLMPPSKHHLSSLRYWRVLPLAHRTFPLSYSPTSKHKTSLSVWYLFFKGQIIKLCFCISQLDEVLIRMLEVILQ